MPIVVNRGLNMMFSYTVSLFGHREIDNLIKLEECLTPILRKLIQAKPFVSFLIGRNGEFDIYTASVIKRMRTELEKSKSDITLVLPYPVANLNFYEAYYNSIVIPETVCGAHPKSAIILRNRWMIDHSDLVIFYVSHKRGGAYAALKYAEKQSCNCCSLIVDFLQLFKVHQFQDHKFRCHIFVFCTGIFNLIF